MQGHYQVGKYAVEEHDKWIGDWLPDLRFESVVRRIFDCKLVIANFKLNCHRFLRLVFGFPKGLRQEFYQIAGDKRNFAFFFCGQVAGQAVEMGAESGGVERFEMLA